MGSALRENGGREQTAAGAGRWLPLGTGFGLSRAAALYRVQVVPEAGARATAVEPVEGLGDEGDEVAVEGQGRGGPGQDAREGREACRDHGAVAVACLLGAGFESEELVGPAEEHAGKLPQEDVTADGGRGLHCHNAVAHVTRPLL